MKFSVLTPAYNASLYIDRCIKSVLAQSFNNFEFIILDDGSSDNTFEICKQYAYSDSRIKLLKQKNQGVATARNILLENSTGDWIAFVDADDYISVDYLSVFSFYIQNDRLNCDLFVCNYYIEKNSVISNGITNKFRDKKEYLCSLLKYKSINTTLWGKIIKKSLIEKENTRFNIEIDMGEDLLFISTLLPLSNNIAFIKERLYYWTANSTSMTASFNFKYTKDIVSVINLIESQYKIQKDYSLYKKSIDNSKITILCDFRLSKDFKVKKFSYQIFPNIFYSDLHLLNKLLLFCLKFDLILIIKIIRKIKYLYALTKKIIIK